MSTDALPRSVSSLFVRGLSITLLGLLFTSDPIASILAQSPVTWTDIHILSSTRTHWSRPNVVSDQWGYVHVFWSDRFSDEYSALDQAPVFGDTIFHAVWDGQSWSSPLDILVQDPGGTYMANPYAVTGADGQINLIWSRGNGLDFSRAPALGAHDAASWQPPQVVVEGLGIDQAKLAIGADGRLHIILGKTQGEWGGNVIYTWSADGGVTWSLPQPISDVSWTVDKVSVAPQIVIDSREWLHVVWTERVSPDWIGQRVLYSRSEDNGETWIFPELLGEVQPGQTWAETPSLAATPDGSLHLVWVCGESAHRCYRSSADGGHAWTPAQGILGDFISWAGWDAMVADRQRTVHFVAQLREPYGIYYAYRPIDGPWSRPILIVDKPGFENGHYPQMTVAAGNQLHVVWQRSAQEGDVVHTMISTSAPTVSGFPVPTAVSPYESALSDQVPAVASTLQGGEALEPVHPAYGNADPKQVAQPALPVHPALLGVLPAALLVVLFVAPRLWKQLRSS